MEFKSFRVGGFTLLELTLVIVILGVLSLSVTSLFTGTAPFASAATQDQLISAARFAQQTAMSRGPAVNVSLVVNGNSYQVLIDGAPIELPGGGFTTNFPNGVAVTPNPAAINFDSLGDSTAGVITLTITVAGEADRTVTIETTGYAH
ncbi:MAG: type II secretion system protein [Gammaproteobacteria bacterium]|nr:type II secretion system protein [Gammaproteobacteria bacterium]